MALSIFWLFQAPSSLQATVAPQHFFCLKLELDMSVFFGILIAKPLMQATQSFHVLDLPDWLPLLS